MGIYSKKILSNSLWMMVEKIVGMVGLIFVNSYMAKYVGPDNYGKIVFASSLFIFVQTFAWFGAQNVYFKRMSENKQSGMLFALSTLRLRRIIFFITSILLLLYLYLYTEFIVFFFGLASFIASYYIISDIFSIYNNSQLNSIINALSNTFGLVIALLVRFLLVYNQANVFYMVIPIILVASIPYFVRWCLYKKQNHIKSIKNTSKYNKYLVNTGGALLLSTLSIVIYTQISNIILAQYTSFNSLAIYNVAMTLGGAWSFINVALVTSFFSKIYAEKNEENKIKLFMAVNYIVIIVSLMVYLFTYFTGTWWVGMLYGMDYIDAVNILGVIVFATMFSNMGMICYRYMIKYDAYKYLSIKMMIVCILSIPLSYFLIKYYGIYGAAYCFLIVEIISLTIANYFYSKVNILKLHIQLLKPYKLFIR